MRDYLKDVLKNRIGREDYNAVFNAMDKVREAAKIARFEGLLDLMDYVDNNELPGMLKLALSLVVDGTDPDVLTDICITKAYVCMDDDRDPLVDLLCIRGALTVQAGETPRIVEERLLSLLPHDKEMEYRAKLEKEDKEHEAEFRKNRKYSSAGISDRSNIVRTFEYLVSCMDEDSVKALIEEVDKTDMALVSKAVCGETLRELFSVLPEKIQDEIIDEADYMGPVRQCDAELAICDIIETIKKLEKEGSLSLGGENASLEGGVIDIILNSSGYVKDVENLKLDCEISDLNSKLRKLKKQRGLTDDK